MNIVKATAKFVNKSSVDCTSTSIHMICTVTQRVALIIANDHALCFIALEDNIHSSHYICCKERISIYCAVFTRVLMETVACDSANEPYIIVFDCESDATFASLFGETKMDKIKFMQFTVTCAIKMPISLILQNRPWNEVMSSCTKHAWWRDLAEHETRNPVHTLLELFDGAVLIVGFNCLGFDFPLLRRFYPTVANQISPEQRYISHRSKTFDIMYRICEATGNYYKLDILLKRNKLSCKTGDGIAAIKLWETGKRDELKNYCEMDVWLTAQLALLEVIKVEDKLEFDNGKFGVRTAVTKLV